MQQKDSTSLPPRETSGAGKCAMARSFLPCFDSTIGMDICRIVYSAASWRMRRSAKQFSLMSGVANRWREGMAGDLE
jgi:hypothetical protein